MWNSTSELHAIEETQLWGQKVGRLKFDFHAAVHRPGAVAQAARSSSAAAFAVCEGSARAMPLYLSLLSARTPATYVWSKR